MDKSVTTDTPFKSKKLGLYISTGVILGLTIILSIWLLMPRSQSLFGNAGTPSARSEAEAYLMDWRVPYQKDEESGHILIDRNEITSVRERLAGVGLPAKERPGFELFSEAEYGMSEFTQKINFQRAVEGEIAQTIRTFADVKSARVHLTIPEDSLFKDKQVAPKASVVVQTKPGRTLSSEQVVGITQLVAASVNKLEAENVIVLNEIGAVVSSEEDGLHNYERNSSHSIEEDYARKARLLVEGVVQTKNIQIAVNARFNFNKVKSIKEQIIPKGDNTNGFLAKKKHQSKNSTSKKPKTKTASPETVFVEEEYLFSRERSEIEYASGYIEKLNIGIVVVKEISEKTINDIERVVASGLGVDLSRGDNISVVSVSPINLTENTKKINGLSEEPVAKKLKDKPVEQALSSIQLNELFYIYGVFAVLVFVGIGIVIAMLVNRRQGPKRLTHTERQRLLDDTRAWIAAEQKGGN